MPIHWNNGGHPALSPQGVGRLMQTSFDSLLVALFMALSPVEHEAQPGLSGDAFRQGFHQGYEQLRLRPEPPGPGDIGNCRYFADAVARSNCVVRTSRPISKSSTTLAFPDQTIWITPDDPGMPFKYSPSTIR